MYQVLVHHSSSLPRRLRTTQHLECGGTPRRQQASTSTPRLAYHEVVQHRSSHKVVVARRCCVPLPSQVGDLHGGSAGTARGSECPRNGMAERARPAWMANPCRANSRPAPMRPLVAEGTRQWHLPLPSCPYLHCAASQHTDPLNLHTPPPRRLHASVRPTTACLRTRCCSGGSGGGASSLACHRRHRHDPGLLGAK